MPRLFEGIVGTGEQPSYFWLVLDIPNWNTNDDAGTERNNNILSQIGKGELTGVKGVSSSKEILTDWWMMCRNAAILLKPSDLLNLNDLEKVEYDNPEQLCANDMAMLYRLFDKRRDAMGTDGLMMNIGQYVQSEISKVNQYAAHLLSYYGFQNVMARSFKLGTDHVETSADLGHFVYKVLEGFFGDHSRIENLRDDLGIDMVMISVRKALKRIGTVYSGESEWIVHSPTLRLPKGSKMLIGCDFEARDQYKEWIKQGKPDTMAWYPLKWRLDNLDRLYTNIEKYRLGDFYDLRYIDSRKWEEVRPKITLKRRPTLPQE